jgi:hypothetical protein
LAISGKNLCKRGLASTISSDKSNLVPRSDPEIHPAHQGSSTDGDLKILDTEQVVDPSLGVLAKALVYNRDRNEPRRR